MLDHQTLRFSVQYKFTGDHDVIETWLRENCVDEFNVTIEKKPINQNSDGNLLIDFKLESDRNRFRDQVLEGF